MHASTDPAAGRHQGPVISLDQPVSDLARMSGFAAAETLDHQHRRRHRRRDTSRSYTTRRSPR